MTKKYTVECNHCHQEIRHKDGGWNGVGLHFHGMFSASLVTVNQSENHLCTDCALAYREALTKLEEWVSVADRRPDAVR